MKQKIKAMLTVAVMFSMVLCINAVAYAAEAQKVATESNQITEYANGGTYAISTEWTEVLSSSTGLGCNVYISCKNTIISGGKVVPTDIQMLGKSGNVIWEESGAIPGQGSRIFICGNDVYKIRLKTQAGLGTAYVRKTAESPD